MLILSGNENKVRAQLSALRMELGNRLGLRKGNVFAPLWVVDFPLLEWDEDTERYHAMHHPFTSPKPEDIHLLETDPESKITLTIWFLTETKSEADHQNPWLTKIFQSKCLIC
jgi:aspartyl-tRNA synthetase